MILGPKKVFVQIQFGLKKVLEPIFSSPHIIGQKTLGSKNAQSGQKCPFVDVKLDDIELPLKIGCNWVDNGRVIANTGFVLGVGRITCLSIYLSIFIAKQPI